MAETTLISWADKTHNHWIGCTKVSVGPAGACEHCYAENLMDHRLGRVTWGGDRVLTSPANRHKPLAWEAEAVKAGTRPFVFCNSLADVFDNQVPIAWLAELFELIEATPHLVWLLLTKRPQNIVKRFRAARPDRTWPKNAAIGFTAVTQAELVRDAPFAVRAKAELRPAFLFVSAEPMRGPMDFSTYVDSSDAIDWVITGGETDQGSAGARPHHPRWFADVAEQCSIAEKPYHHKSNGEWVRWTPAEDTRTVVHVSERDGCWGYEPGSVFVDSKRTMRADTAPMVKVGKKRADRLINGKTYDARPVVA